MSQPVVPAVAQWGYERFPDAWRESDSDAAGWLLLGLTAGLLEPLAEPWDLVEDPVEFLDVETTADKWLPLDAAMNGARLAPGMSEQQQRNETANPTGWRRALPDSIREAATKYLEPGVAFLFLERRDPDVAGDQPAHITMLLHASDVESDAEAEQIQASFLATIPVGIFGHLYVVGQWWTEEAEAGHASWTAAAAAHSTWTDLSEGD